jgi:hypothetical protein
MNTRVSQDMKSVLEYYTQPRLFDGVPQTIYQIWEGGNAADDSVTPSTFCKDYQRHMMLKLQTLAQGQGKVYSIGCGNAAVESLLVQQGLAVRAIDCTEEAVKLARSKGVDAYVADVMSMSESALRDISVVYADGLAGHVFSPETGLQPFFAKLLDLGIVKGAWIMISNDAPMSRDKHFEPHAKVSDFWYLSPQYLANSMDEVGFQAVEMYTFPYFRPLSGLRHRAICIAKA